MRVCVTVFTPIWNLEHGKYLKKNNNFTVGEWYMENHIVYGRPLENSYDL